MSEDPYRAYNFKLEIEGMTQGHFTEVSGLGAKIESIPYREAGSNQVVTHIPGQVEYLPVKMRFGVTDSTDLMKMFMSAAEGNVQRKNISIVLLGPDGSTEVARWNLINAWVSEWLGAPLNALGNEIAIEQVTFSYDTLERA